MKSFKTIGKIFKEVPITHDDKKAYDSFVESFIVVACMVGTMIMILLTKLF